MTLYTKKAFCPERRATLNHSHEISSPFFDLHASYMEQTIFFSDGENLINLRILTEQREGILGYRGAFGKVSI